MQLNVCAQIIDCWSSYVKTFIDNLRIIFTNLRFKFFSLNAVILYKFKILHKDHFYILNPNLSSIKSSRVPHVVRPSTSDIYCHKIYQMTLLPSLHAQQPTEGGWTLGSAQLLTLQIFELMS